MRFGKSEWSSWDRAIEREWLLTNGIGGFSSSTIIGANSRRYHGLLIASLNPPVERHLILSQLHETVLLDGSEYDLHSFSTGNYIKMGCFCQQSFELDPLPVFTYSFADLRIEKTVALVYGENTVVVQYRIITGASGIAVKIAPLVNFRDYHGNSARPFMRFRQQAESDHTVIEPYDTGLKILIGCYGSCYEAVQDCWFTGMYYPAENERGLQAYEDHYIPGIFHIKAEPECETCVSVVCTTETDITVSACGSDSAAGYLEASYGQQVIESEIKRIERLTAGCRDDFERALTRSADHFIVYRRSTGAKTILAGYPWFTDWGRDAMISLSGLTLSTGRYRDAAEILTTFSKYIKYGLVPNMFPDAGEEPAYNTVDAALWYFEAVYRYVMKTHDLSLIKDHLYDSMLQIIEGYKNGTLHNIHMDDDSLIAAGNEDTQLTWMDAMADGTVFTPRHGKAVEINALWYNALKIMENITAWLGIESSAYGRLADIVKRNFERTFWNEKGAYLFDVVNGEYKDDSIRPNQIFAVSLSYPVISGQMAESVVKKVWNELYTAYGLRSLSPHSDGYKGMYLGSRYDRDSAYHQGTVWAWLMGHFITAYSRTLGKKPVYADMPAKFLEPFKDHLNHACLGSISEIFDGDEPLKPRGCFAQAWSVAEVLRAYTEIINGTEVL